MAVFNKIAYALSFIEVLKTIDSEEFLFSPTLKENQNPSLHITKNNNRKQSVKRMSEEEFENFIWSKIEWDHDIEKKAGLSFYNYQISEYNDFEAFEIIFEIKGKIKTNHFSLEYSMFDNNGRLRSHGFAFVESKGFSKPVGNMLLFYNRLLDSLNRVVITANY
ncbi:MAG: hypothetical protein J1F67_10725 [Muribaculaceae bacterium]|nr:hypothetical protein [Muribaculaceae bacterium]